MAARRELLRSLPFVTGYGVDIALLLDAHAAVGLDRIAQVDPDVRQNAPQPLRDLGPMAFEVLRAVATRLEREGRLSGPLPASFPALVEPARSDGRDWPAAFREPVERPPLAQLRAAA